MQSQSTETAGASLGSSWLYTLRAGIGMGWLAFIAALFVLFGALGQLVGFCSPAGTRSIVLYSAVIGLFMGLCHCAITGTAVNRLAGLPGGLKTNGTGLGTAVAASVLYVLTIGFACAAGSAASSAASGSGGGAIPIQSPPDSSKQQQLSPASGAGIPYSPTPALSLRLQ